MKMKKYGLIVSMLLLICGLAGCGGGNLSLISCPEQGFTTKADPSYTWETDEADGLYIYVGDKGSVPYVHISWLNDITSVDDARAYLSETVQPTLKNSQPEGSPFVASETSDKQVGGKEMPAGEYMYDEQGQTMMMLLAFDTTGEHTVVYQAKYLSEQSEETLDVLDKAVRNFKAGDDPKTENADPDLLDAPDLVEISCPEFGFSTMASPAFPWTYKDGFLYIWVAGEENHVPYIEITQYDNWDPDPYDTIQNIWTPKMQEDYGDNLFNFTEYEAYEIGGKQIAGGLYTYMMDGASGAFDKLILRDNSFDPTVEYHAYWLSDRDFERQAVLEALDDVIRNLHELSNENEEAPTSNGNKEISNLFKN